MFEGEFDKMSEGKQQNGSNNARDQLPKNLVNFLRLFLLCLSAIVGIICSLLECSLNTGYLVSNTIFSTSKMAEFILHQCNGFLTS